MCDGRIHRTQRFPANPDNGQVPVWNAITKKWEAQNQSGGGSLPPGSNPNDMLYWDATNEEWIVGAEVSGFNPTADYSIDGRFDFSNALLLSQVDPSSAFSPITGVSIFADTSDNFTVKRADGIRYSFSSAYLSVDRKFTFPDRDGKFAMSDFDNEFTATQSFTQINTGRSGAAGKVNWYNDAGSLVSASGIVPGASNFFHEGNDFNFRTNATGFFFGGGSSWISPTARLHVRGDGINPIARFQASNGVDALQIDSTGLRITSSQAASSRMSFGTGGSTISGGWGGASGFALTVDNAVGGNLTGQVAGAIQGFLAVSGTFASATLNGNATFRPISIAYIINNSQAQTGTATGIFLNATLASLNGMIHNFIDIQSSGISRFRVSEIGGAGFVFSDNYNVGTRLYFNNSTGISAPTNGNLILSNFAGTDFNRLQFGGSTNLFPSIKRNGAILEVKLADDSAYASLSANSLFAGGSVMAGGGNAGFYSGGEGIAVLRNSALDGFNRLNFGGTTNAFPALKRSGASLEVRLADDSNYAGITADILTTIGPNAYLVTQQIFSGADGTTRFGNGVLMGFVSTGKVHASAAVEIRTTTRGFLPPRMTTTERDAIASPAEGLEIYNTTEKAKQFWNGIAWKTILTA